MEWPPSALRTRRRNLPGSVRAHQAGRHRRGAKPHSIWLPSSHRASWRSKRSQPLKSLLDAGIPLALRSDGPTNPYLDIMFATNPGNRPSEAITREQAVTAYTLTSAYAEFQEQEKVHSSRQTCRSRGLIPGHLHRTCGAITRDRLGDDVRGWQNHLPGETRKLSVKSEFHVRKILLSGFKQVI